MIISPTFVRNAFCFLPGSVTIFPNKDGAGKPAGVVFFYNAARSNCQGGVGVMLVVWIGWIYVVLMIAVGQDSLVRSGLILFFLGVLPSLLMFFVIRRRQRLRAEGFIAPRRRRP